MIFTANRLDFGTIPRPAFGQARQHVDTSPHKARAQARYMRAAKLAAELLPELPKPGESVHCLMTGNYDLCQVIANTVKRLPACRHLRIATLCYSKRNITELSALLETRKGLPLTLLVSVFHREHNKDLHQWAVEELTQYPNVKIAAARSHCKVALFDIGNDDGLIFEGSANLRSNRNREQLTVIRDRPLHDWHVRWIDELVRADGQEEGPRS